MGSKIEFGDIISFEEEEKETKIYSGIVIGKQQEPDVSEPYGYLVLLLNSDESTGWEDAAVASFIACDGKWSNDDYTKIIPAEDFYKIVKTHNIDSIYDCRFWWINQEQVINPIVKIIAQINQELNE